MIDFIYKINEILPSWLFHDKKSLNQIAEATGTSVPHVIQFLSEGLDRDIEIGSSVSIEEISDAIVSLSRRFKLQIEEREKQIAQRRQKALAAYVSIQDKIQSMQISNQWHTAFRTLYYFIGQYEPDLPYDVCLCVYNDLIRIGIKAKAHLQEVVRWLEKGVSLAMRQQSRSGIEDALDFIDAYGEFFLNEDSGKGSLLLGGILASIEEPAARYELWEEYKNLINQLYPS